MTKKELSFLICPYCHSKFHLGQIFKKNKQQIEFGSVYCQCDEFPILFGILYLHKNHSKKILENLQNKQFTSALCIAFEFSYKKIFLLKIFIHINNFFHISPNNFINHFLINLLWKIPPSQFKYYFHRHQEIESLLFFVPLSFSQSSSASLWLDVGSGISNYYSELHHFYPKLTIISLENLFQNIFLSRLFFPKNILYICSDFSTGPILPFKSLDVITFIDSLSFMENQRQSLEISIQNLLKKDGIFFASSLTEHLYIHDFFHNFPISTRLIKKFLPSPPQIFDEIKLCQNLFTKNALQKSLLKKNSLPLFRYCFLWPKQKLPPKLFFPKSIIQTKLTLWQNAIIQHKNKVY